MEPMIATLTAVALLLFGANAFMGVRFLDVRQLALAPWILSLGFLVSGIAVWPNPINWLVFLSILSGLVLFQVGAYLGAARPLRAERSPTRIHNLAGVGVAGIGAATFLYFALVLVDSVRAVHTLGGPGALTVTSLRALYLDTHTGVTGPLDLIKSLTRLLASVAAVGSPAIWRRHSRVAQGIVVAAWSGLFMETAFAGGRDLFILILLGFTLFFAFRRRIGGLPAYFRQHRGQAAVAILLVLLLGYYTFGVFPAQRNPLLEEPENVNMVMSWYTDGRISDAVINSGIPGLPQFAYGSTYLSHPIPTYTFFIEEGKTHTWYEAGRYNFPPASRFISLITQEPSSWNDIRTRLADVTDGAGRTANPWATGLRDFAIDVGIVGTAVLLFVWGFVAQRIQMAAWRRPTFDRVILLAVVCVALIRFPFTSPFLSGTVLNIMLLLGVVTLLRRASQTCRLNHIEGNSNTGDTL